MSRSTTEPGQFGARIYRPLGVCVVGGSRACHSFFSKGGRGVPREVKGEKM